MKYVLLCIMLSVHVAGTQNCLVEDRDSMCSFVLREPCQYQLTKSSCKKIIITVNNIDNHPCVWRWKTEDFATFQQIHPGMGVTGNHFWSLSVSLIFERAHQVFTVICRHSNLSQGPISFLLSGECMLQ